MATEIYGEAILGKSLGVEYNFLESKQYCWAPIYRERIQYVHPLPLPPAAATPLPINSLWEKGDLIGRGSCARVYVATNRETRALCAMKEVELFPNDPISAEREKQLQQEIEVLSQLKHLNIVKYYGSEKVDGKFRIYLEYVPGGSINKYVQEHGAIQESVVRKFTGHILSGLSYLHSTKTIHRDIKGANLLLDSSGVVKLADFGVAKHLTGQAAILSFQGTAHWMAPEILRRLESSSPDAVFAVDIWSVGCTVLEMLTGRPPWGDLELNTVLCRLYNSQTPPIPETLSSEVKEFLRRCFQIDPARRPSAAELRKDPFLKD